MTALALTGALVGLGVVLVVSALWSGRPSLASLDAAARPPVSAPPLPGASPLVRLAGRLAARVGLGERHLVRSPLAADLRVTATTAEEHLATRVMLALAGLTGVPAAAAVATLGGGRVSWVLPTWAALGAGVAGFFTPLALLRGEAAERRQTFRHGLSSYLHMVSVALAGGQGVDQALTDATEAGRTWVFAELRTALGVARFNGQPPWSGFARLGEDLGVPELTEVAASCRLAGDEGARVRQSISAKARALQGRVLSETEGRANSATEGMSLPLVLLLLGFVTFLGYPAVIRVLGGL